MEKRQFAFALPHTYIHTKYSHVTFLWWFWAVAFLCSRFYLYNNRTPSVSFPQQALVYANVRARSSREKRRHKNTWTSKMRRKENEVPIHFFIKCHSFETLKLIPKGLNTKFRPDIEISFLLRYRHTSTNGTWWFGRSFTTPLTIYLFSSSPWTHSQLLE